MGKYKHFTFTGFLNFLGESEIHTIPKLWKKWIPIAREKYDKTQTFQKLSVSEIFRFNQKSKQFPKHGKNGFPLYRNSMGKHKHFKFMGFLNILDEAEIHTIPRTWEKWISIIREKYGKKQTFKSKGFSTILIKAEIHTIPKIWKKWIPIVRKKYEKTQTFQS